MGTIREILKRFISDKSSFNDYLSVSSFFKEEKHSEALSEQMKEEWNNTGNTGDKHERLSQLLNKLHHQINLRQPVKPESGRDLYHSLFKLAAILLIPSLIAIGVLSYFLAVHEFRGEAFAEIHAPMAARVRFQLPDGTVGWLNSGSSIRYPVNFKNRKVEISGEAWFDVVHQSSNEFRVITPCFDVKVLGTMFNVVAYNNEESAQVILERGKVAVYDKYDNISTELVPDQQFIYDKKTRKSVRTSIDAKAYTSWKDGVLIFRNVPMKEIVRRLERHYHADIVLHDDSLKEMVFRATFYDEGLEEICRMLSIVAPIRYKIHEREKQANDTFTKNRIEMWLK
ncbi:MAG: FecR family protein [Mangrovibacterium sp.]